MSDKRGLSSITPAMIRKMTAGMTPKKLPDDGGRLIREDLVPVLNELAAKSFPGLVFTPGPSPAIKHEWSAPYGTPMTGITNPLAQGMALGNGGVWCFNHDRVENDFDWRTNTE